MGIALPGAIAAKLIYPEKRVLACLLYTSLRLADGAGSFVGGAHIVADGLSLPAHGKAAYKKRSRHPPRGHRCHAGGAGVRTGDQGVQPESAVYRRPEPQLSLIHI